MTENPTEAEDGDTLTCWPSDMPSPGAWKLQGEKGGRWYPVILWHFWGDQEDLSSKWVSNHATEIDKPQR